MKLTLKVGLLRVTVIRRVRLISSLQDLKQQKFTIDAEPTETVSASPGKRWR